MQYQLKKLTSAVQLTADALRRQPAYFGLIILLCTAVGSTVDTALSFMLSGVLEGAAYTYSALIADWLIFMFFACVAIRGFADVNWAKREQLNGQILDMADRLWGIVGTGLLQIMLILIGTMLMILPGIAVALVLLFPAQIIVMENKVSMTAIKRSYEIAKSNWTLSILAGGLYGGLLLIVNGIFVTLGTGKDAWLSILSLLILNCLRIWATGMLTYVFMQLRDDLSKK